MLGYDKDAGAGFPFRIYPAALLQPPYYTDRPAFIAVPRQFSASLEKASTSKKPTSFSSSVSCLKKRFEAIVKSMSTS